MDLYFNRHDGDAATIEDFICCFEDATKTDLSHFARWYAQAGTPELICELKYDPTAKAATLTVNQSLSPSPGQPKKEPLYIPLRLGLLGPNGHDLTLQLDNGQTIENGVVAVTERTQSFKFVNIPARPVPSLLRGFSAPVNLTIDMPEADLAFLMMHDSDLFNRWQAANQYATRTILAGLEAPDAIGSAAKSYAAALAAALSDPGLDEAYKAELLKLPTQSDIAREKRSNVDHAVIDRAHSAFARAVASELETLLCDVYQAAADRGPFTPDAKSAGRRALRNAALTLLSSRAGPSDLARLETHFITATNMTDQAHAMMLLAHHDVPARTRALSNFFERWKDDHLVIDTWFAAQAQSSLPGTLDAVSELCANPLFKITTPNKVRALIGTFAMSNPLQFNRPGGEGYRFVADKVLQIDAVNPQVAARLLGSFRSFKALEPKRRELAEAALRSVSGSPRISRDVAEIVLRMLES
jgi:aminopeptidase N